MDGNISSPLLHVMMNPRRYRGYEWVDDAVRADDWNGVKFLLDSKVRIKDPRYFSYELGRSGMYFHLGPYSISDVKRKHVLHGAASGGHIDILERLPYTRASTSIACYGARYGHLQIVKWAIRRRTTGYLAIQYHAKKYGHTHIIDWMKKKEYI